MFIKILFLLVCLTIVQAEQTFVKPSVEDVLLEMLGLEEFHPYEKSQCTNAFVGKLFDVKHKNQIKENTTLFGIAKMLWEITRENMIECAKNGKL